MHSWVERYFASDTSYRGSANLRAREVVSLQSGAARWFDMTAW